MEITNYLIECVKNNFPVSFSKYGDGEIFCMFRISPDGANCDNDRYTEKLGDALLQSFLYMISINDACENQIQHNDKPKHFIGKWHSHPEHFEKLENLTLGKNILWAKYHTLLFDRDNDDKKISLLKTIKNAKQKKIMICNEDMKTTQDFLKIDKMVYVPKNNWFDTLFNNVFEEVVEYIENSKNCDCEGHIVITCCGQSAKVMICQLVKKYPNGIYLDYGSGLDKLITGRDTREYHTRYTNEEMEEIKKYVIMSDKDE